MLYLVKLENNQQPYVVNRNVELKNIPLAVDKILNMLSAATGKTKLALYREAIIEYAERHKGDIAAVAERQTI